MRVGGVAEIRKTALCCVLKSGGKGKQSGSVLCGVSAIRAKENDEKGEHGGVGYPGRRGTEEFRTAGEQRLRETSQLMGKKGTNRSCLFSYSHIFTYV